MIDIDDVNDQDPAKFLSDYMSVDNVGTAGNVVDANAAITTTDELALVQ